MFVELARHHHKVCNDDTPADPTLKPAWSVIRTASQLHSPAHYTNASFDAIAKPLSLFEPFLFFVRLALGCAMPRLGNRNPFDPQLPR